MIRAIRILIVVFFMQLLLSVTFAQELQFVRVAIEQDTQSFSLKIKGPYEVIDYLSRKVVYLGDNLNATVTLYKNNILLGDAKSNLAKIFIRSTGNEDIIVGGRIFRNGILLIKKDNGRILVVNEVSLEDYVKGILYHEVSHYWPPEVLKAQAIVCRTYAIYQLKQNGSRDYDLTNDIYSQVYGGKTSERYRTNSAVDVTKGMVLEYNAKIFPAYFHSVCGGHTEDANLLWSTDIAPLKGVVCGFCKDAPRFSWHAVLSLKEIEEKLRPSLEGRNKQVKDILVSGRDPSGRITDLILAADQKQSLMPVKTFRNLLGPNVIRSANFTVKVIKPDVVFEGVGWGHGVGMCQWGAYFMAKEGKGFPEILKYYYPGAEIIRFKK